jgi:hypothetical protein
MAFLEETKSKEPSKAAYANDAITLQNNVVDVANRSMERYTDNRSEITEVQPQDFLGGIFSTLQNSLENLGEKPTNEQLYEVEYLSNVLMSSLQLNEMAKSLEKAGYSDNQIKQTLEQNNSFVENAYMQARGQGKTHEAAMKLASEVQMEYLSTVYSSLDKKHRAGFEKACGLVLRQTEISSRALKTRNDNAIDAAFDAVTEEEQRKVIKQYSLMSDFAANALFASTTAMFSSTAQDIELEEGVGMDSPAEAGMAALEFFLTEEQRAQDETRSLEELDKLIEELEQKKKGEEIDSKEQQTLKKCGLEAQSPKEAAKLLKDARKQAAGEAERVQELRTPQHFVKGKGGWTLENDERKGTEYPKMPAFYPPKKAGEIIAAAKPVIEKSQKEFPILAAQEFAGEGLGTIVEALPEADLENEKAPETIVMQALSNPDDKELNKEMERVLANPLNVGVKAALLEAYARAVNRLAKKNEM